MIWLTRDRIRSFGASGPGQVIVWDGRKYRNSWQTCRNTRTVRSLVQDSFSGSLKTWFLSPTPIIMEGMNTENLDAAIEAIKNAAREFHDVEPADLSAHIGGLAELCWNINHLTNKIITAYDRIGPLRDDQDGDPDIAVEMIRARLGDVATRLTDIDEAIQDAHNHAARLARA